MTIAPHRIFPRAARWAAPVAALLGLAATLPALETSLVLTGPQSTGDVVTISPGGGTLCLFSVNDSGSTRNSLSNFLTDLQFLDKRVPNPPQNGNIFSDLRTGSPNNKPTSIGNDSLLEQLSKTVSDDDKKKNQKSPYERAHAAEDKFWSTDHPYDGKIRAAFNGQYLFIAVPSRHAVLLYELDGQNFKIKAWANYGPELLLGQSYNTVPTPQEMFQTLPDDQKKKLEDAAKDTGPAVAETPKSDPWVVAGTNGSFALVDIPNKVVISYQFTGSNLTMNSVRYITYDLMIPTGWKSQPDEQQGAQDYLKKSKDVLAKMGIATDPAGLQALVKDFSAQGGGDAGGGGGDQTGLQGTMDGDHLVLDFTGEHKLLCYSLAGGGPLTMISARDYTIDTALSFIDKMLREKLNAADFIGLAKKNFKIHDFALRTLRTALNFDPLAVDDVEKDGRLKAELSKEPEWLEIMTDAHKRAEELKAKIKAMAEDAEKIRHPPKDPGK
jgi:hypothetical protein